jgi:hypothetical protein
MLYPAIGLVPLERLDEKPIYTFQVSAQDKTNRKLFAIAETYVRPGESRRVKQDTPLGTHIAGYVNLTHEGVATYQAELTMSGKPVARTNATLAVKEVP